MVKLSYLSKWIESFSEFDVLKWLNFNKGIQVTYLSI